MTKEEKKKKVKELLDSIESVVNAGIDAEKDSGLYPYELVLVSTQLLVEAAVTQAAFNVDTTPQLTLDSKFDEIHKAFIDIANKFKDHGLTTDTKTIMPPIVLDKKSRFDN